MLTSLTGAAAVALVVVLGACSKDEGAKSEPSSSKPAKTATAPKSSTAATPGAGGEKGLAAKDNDPKVIALLQPVLKCPWESGGFKLECEDWVKWQDAKDEFKDGAADNTLINLMEDPDEKVRYAATWKLDFSGAKYQKDKNLATRVVAVAEQEKTTKFAGLLGSTLAEIDFDKTGLWERIKALATKSEHAHLRVSLLSHMLTENKDFAPAVALAMEAIKHPDPQIKQAAVSAFRKYAGAKKVEACKFLLDNSDEHDPAAPEPAEELAVQAARSLAENPECEASIDPLLDLIEKRLKDKHVRLPAWDWAVSNVCGNPKANDKQKARGEAIAKALSTPDTNNTYVRRDALDAVLKCDPKGGNAVVQGYTSDKDDPVRKHAKDSLANK